MYYFVFLFVIAFVINVCWIDSLENLLFICELIQFKRSLSDQHLNGKVYGWMEELPHEFIPECEAIAKYGGNYLGQVKLIYRKYIALNAPLEINISARRRRRIVNLFDEEKHDGKVAANLMKQGWKKLSMIFDRCAVEIWKLMNDSFGRIMETEKYEKWHNLLPNTENKEECDRNQIREEAMQLNVPSA